MRIANKTKRWMLAYYQNPFLYSEKEVMKKTGITSYAMFNLKFKQTILEARKKQLHDWVQI